MRAPRLRLQLRPPVVEIRHRWAPGTVTPGQCQTAADAATDVLLRADQLLPGDTYWEVTIGTALLYGHDLCGRCLAGIPPRLIKGTRRVVLSPDLDESNYTCDGCGRSIRRITAA